MTKQEADKKGKAGGYRKVASVTAGGKAYFWHKPMSPGGMFANWIVFDRMRQTWVETQG